MLSAIWLSSCVVKPDALLISSKNAEPVIQVRCILVPDYPAQVHSIVHAGNGNLSRDSVYYTLSSSDGSSQTVAHWSGNVFQYLNFPQIIISEGKHYTLNGKLGDDIFEQQVYIPMAVQDLSVTQNPYSPDIPFSLRVEGTNENIENTNLIFPMELLDKYHGNRRTTDDSFSFYYHNYESTTSSDERVGFWLSESKNRGFQSDIASIPSGIFKISLEDNIYTVSDEKRFWRNNQKWTYPFYYFKPNIRYDTAISDSTSYYRMAYCDDTSLDIIKNMPEWTNKDEIPPFTNIPYTRFNINSGLFKGYLIGFSLSRVPHFYVKDNSKIIKPFKIVRTSGHNFIESSDEYIPEFYAISLGQFGLTEWNLRIIEQIFSIYGDETVFEKYELTTYNLRERQQQKFFLNEKIETYGDFRKLMNTVDTLTFYER